MLLKVLLLHDKINFISGKKKKSAIYIYFQVVFTGGI